MSIRDELAEQWKASSTWDFDDWLCGEIERLRAELAREEVALRIEQERQELPPMQLCPHCSDVSPYSTKRQSYVCPLCGPWQHKPE